MYTGIDVLILTIYVLCVVYVFAVAVDSLFIAQVAVVVDLDRIKQELEKQNLHNSIGIQFLLAPKYVPDQLRELNIRIENKSQQAIYVDWDQSCFIDIDKRSQRLVRLTSALTFELLPTQAFSVIPAGQSILEKITAEATLKRDAQTGLLKPDTGLVNFARLKRNPRQRRMPRVTKLLDPSVDFFLALVLRLSEPAVAGGGSPNRVISCRFTVQRLPWTAAIPRPPRRF